MIQLHPNSIILNYELSKLRIDFTSHPQARIISVVNSYIKIECLLSISILHII